jgi:hypothetical protein
MRLVVFVEGATEEAFVNTVLKPHLAGLVVNAVVAGKQKARGSEPRAHGGGSWSGWRRDLERLVREQPGNDVRFTTMFDLYGLPAGFPGLAEHGADVDTRRRCEQLEAALANEMADWRLIPYLQRHEFEALVLAALPALRDWLDRGEIDALSEAIAGLDPEDVNDGADTAPSKRLLRHLRGYRKALHGPLVIESAGLPELRRRCPRFGTWLARLEALTNERATSR